MNIKTIAKIAGVSVTTASRVLNHPKKVSPETRDHVLSVMKELNYTPNWFARNIQSSRTNMIGLIVPNFSDPGIMEIVKGVEDVAHQKGSNVLVCNTEYDKEKELEYVQTLMEKKVDGIVLISTTLGEKNLLSIKETGMAYVLIGKNEDYTNHNLVYTNYKESVKDAILYLLKIGRKNIAFVIGDNPKTEMKLKLDGYKAALNESSIDFNENMISYGENSIEGGYLAAGSLLNTNNTVDGIFVSSDVMAFGVLELLKQREIDVPDKIALIGYGDLQTGAIIDPKLTTISKPKYRMGLTGTRLLFDIIEGDADMDDNNEIMIQSKLKIRKSCGNKDRLKEIW